MRLMVALVCALFLGAAAAEAASPQELSYWRSIEDSRDARDFERYLQLYPRGDFAEAAERRATRFRRPSASL